MLHTLPFVKFLLSEWDKIITPSKAPMTRMITSLAIQLWSAPMKLNEKFEIPPMDQSDIVQFLVLNYDYNFAQQQDAFEILNRIVSQINDEFSDVENNSIKKLFYGKLCDEIMCKGCGNSACLEYDFNSLSIPFVYKKNNSLIKMIKKWTKWNTEKNMMKFVQNVVKYVLFVLERLSKTFQQ